jgi:hypothetical protein
MKCANTTKTERFETAITELIERIQELKDIPDGWDGVDILRARIEQVEYHMAYLPEIFREGDQND